MSNRKIINAAATGGIGYYPVGNPTDAYYDNVSLLLTGDVEVDSNFANVSLLLDGNTLTDKSNNKAAVTAYGNAAVTSVNKKFGTGSYYFDGTGDYIRPAASDNYMFGTGDFTVEFWVYRISGGEFFGNGPAGGGSFGIGLGATTGDTTKLQCGIYGYPAANVSCANAFPSNQWVYVAITRASGTTRIFVNGIKDGENVNGGANNSTNTASIGEIWAGSGSTLNGYIDDLRITKGVARYTANFTPPVKALPTHEILDSSVYRLPVTASGNARIDTATKKFGTGAMYFDGSGDYLSFPLTSNFIIGSNDYTLEAWIRMADPTTGGCIYTDRVNSPDYSGIIVNVRSGYLDIVVSINGSSWATNGWLSASGTQTITANVWTHIAVCKSANVWTMYVNGVLSKTVTLTGNPTQTQSTTFIGYDPGGIPSFNGYIDDLRITKGYARYTANFPPGPSASLPTIPPTIPADPWWGNVSLLLDGNTTDAYDPYWQNVSLMLTGDDFIDWSNQHNAVTNNGTVTLSTTTKKFNASAYSFSGSNYLTIPTSSNFSFGTGNFSIEFWVRFNTVGADQQVLSLYSNASTARTIALYTAANGTLNYYLSNNGSSWDIASGVLIGNISISTWYYVALVRNGNTFTPYLGAISGTPTTSALSINGATSPVYIGSSFIPSSYFSGQIADLRITKGIARTITVPTAALPAYKIQDRTQNNLTVTPYGNVQLSTDVFKNGTGSMFFDGTGDYLSVTTSPTFNFGTGDFTVEMWVNPTSVNSIRGLFATSGGAGAGIPKFVVLLNSGTPSIHYNGFTNGANIYTTATAAIAAGVWTHLAFVRTGSTWVWYINGIAAGTGSNTSDITFTSQPTYAGYGGETGFDPFNGYIDDFRITKGYARYTQNFTPPSQSFATQYISTGYDANYADVSLLLNGNGTNGSQVFNDLSGTPKTITAYGNAQISTVQKKYGTGAMAFDGSGDYLSIANNTSINLSGGNFTIECWVYPTGGAGTIRNIIQKRTTGGATSYQMYIGSTNTLSFYIGTGELNGSISVPLNAWTHCAAVYSSGTLTLYVNGVNSYSNTLTISEVDTPVLIGYTPGYGYDFSGYIDDLRITKGVARYTTNFTPPTYQLPTDTTGTVIDPLRSSTSLLLRGNGTNGSTSFTDESPNGLTVTVGGNAQISTSAKKYGTGSISFDGTGDYLAIAPSSTFTMGTGDFTFEMWAYQLTAKDCTYFEIRDDAGGTNAIGIGARAANTIFAWINGSFVLTSSSTISLNTWNHIACTRIGATVTLYCNGVSFGTVTNSTNISCTNASVAGPIDLRDTSSSWKFNGYIDDLRITKGYARYTSNFTPPTYEDPIVTGTVYDYNYPQVSLLLNGDGTNGSTVFNDLSSSPKTITNTGSVAVNTSVKKFGTGSMAFSGSNYLTINNPILDLGAGSFTIELWWNSTLKTNYQSILIGTGNLGAWLHETSTGGMLWGINGSTFSASSTDVCDGIWHHVAFVRNGTSACTLYIDGVNSVTASNSTDITGTTTATIGTYGGTRFVTGYIDDLRITKGLARYTQNFTPPTAPLPTSYS